MQGTAWHSCLPHSKGVDSLQIIDTIFVDLCACNWTLRQRIFIIALSCRSNGESHFLRVKVAVVNIGLVQGIIIHKQGYKSGEKWSMHYKQVRHI